MFLRTSPTPIGLKPWFLSKGISRQAKNASIDQDLFSVGSFFATLANV